MIITGIKKVNGNVLLIYGEHLKRNVFSCTLLFNDPEDMIHIALVELLGTKKARPK